MVERGRIDGYEVIVEDVTNQRELEDSLRDQATKDSLTGLANYRHLIDILDSEIKRSARTGRQFALLLFDLDQLKKINDRYGHVTGSRALCRLADALCVSCRDIDTAARFGGDEFALVLPETGAEPAGLVAQRICNTLASDGRRAEAIGKRRSRDLSPGWPSDRSPAVRGGRGTLRNEGKARAQRDFEPGVDRRKRWKGIAVPALRSRKRKLHQGEPVVSAHKVANAGRLREKNSRRFPCT